MKQISKKQWIVIGVGVVAGLFVAGSIWIIPAKVQAPAVATSTSTPTSVTNTGVATESEAVSVPPFLINSADKIISWSFTGSFASSDVLVAQAKADVAHLTGLAGKGQYDDYDIYNGRANDYTSLGDGAAAYADYNRAIQIHPKKGLSYANLAHLMDQLGAYHTAADAYTKAVAVEPSTLEYHIERLTFLTRQFPKDNASIVAAFSDASKQFGDTSAILSIEARWLASQSRYADAIKAWQTVKMISPADRQAAIDAEIARLQAKQ